MIVQKFTVTIVSRQKNPEMKPLMEPYTAVIFDMDGLLLDTERIALEYFVKACRAFDFEPDIDVYVRCIGTNSAATRVILTEGYGPEFPYEAVQEVWTQNYQKAVRENPIPMKPGAEDLLNHFKQNDIRLAVATSTKYETAVHKLKNAGVLHFFEKIIGGDQVENSKPHPEIYLQVSTFLGANPADCLALEDSDNGVLSAYRAGMQVVQIPDLREPSDEVRNLGHPILPSLDEVLHFLK
jgi:HAD superfamily hydrolase (TIGR01509 family)